MKKAKKIMFNVLFYVVIFIGAIAVGFIKLTFLLAKGVVKTFGTEQEKAGLDGVYKAIMADENYESEMDIKVAKFIRWMICC